MQLGRPDVVQGVGLQHSARATLGEVFQAVGLIQHDTVGIGLLHGVVVMSLPKRCLRIAALLENDFRSLFRRVPVDVATDEGEHCRDIAAHHTGKGKSVSFHLVG